MNVVTTDIRVLVVDDDALVRSALAMVLGDVAGIRLVGEAADGDDVVATVDAHRPDVVLMDVRCRASTVSPRPSCCVAGSIHRR